SGRTSPRRSDADYVRDLNAYPPGTSGRSRTTIGVDYLERQARNRDIGLKGEHLVVEHERAWLSANGRPDLAERVAHIPSTLGDGARYDVSSFLPDGTPHHIEVKATRGSITAPFSCPRPSCAMHANTRTRTRSTAYST